MKAYVCMKCKEAITEENKNAPLWLCASKYGSHKENAKLSIRISLCDRCFHGRV